MGEPVDLSGLAEVTAGLGAVFETVYTYGCGIRGRMLDDGFTADVANEMARNQMSLTFALYEKAIVGQAAPDGELVKLRYVAVCAEAFLDTYKDAITSRDLAVPGLAQNALALQRALAAR